MSDTRNSKDSSEAKNANEAPAAAEQEMTLWQTTQSVLWAMLGVQSKKNARRDFSKGKFSHFLIIGVVFALVFILTIVSVVRVILSSAA